MAALYVENTEGKMWQKLLQRWKQRYFWKALFTERLWSASSILQRIQDNVKNSWK